MRCLGVTVVLALAGCGATTGAPDAPTAEPPPPGLQPGEPGYETEQSDLAERVIAAMSDCEARARCCPDLDEPRAQCEDNMEPFRSMMRTVFRDSPLRAAGAARFDPRAVDTLEEDVAACRPLVQGDDFLNGLIYGTVADGGSCGDGNAIDAAACQRGLACGVSPETQGNQVVMVCGPPPRPIRRPPPTIESTYCRPFEQG